MSAQAPPSTSPSVPTDIVFQVLLCRLRYKLSFRDISKFFLLRGFEFTHETVRDWEERFASLFAQQLRAKRQGKVGKIWFVDETYLRVSGRWCDLYRVAQHSPHQVATDGHRSYPTAIAEELGEGVEHEVISCP